MILLVDDDIDFLNVCQSILKDYGFTVLAYTSGEEALEAFHGYSDKISLIVSDYSMSGMNGLQLIQTIRTYKPEMEGILMSGNFNKQIPSSITLLHKPFPFKKLIAKVNILLNL